MLMRKKRFQFDNKYLYGSAAFLAGFGGIMTLLVNLTPVNVPSSNIGTIPEASKSQEATNTPTGATASSDQVQPTSPAANNSVPVSQPTVNNNEPVVTPTAPVETPAPTTSEPVVTTPETPADSVVEEPEAPVITLPEIPVVTPILDTLIP